MSEPENNGAKAPEDKAAKEKETREKIEKIATSALNTAKEATKIAMPYLKKGFEGGMSLIKAGIKSGKQKMEDHKKAAEVAKAAQPAAPVAAPVVTEAPVTPPATAATAAPAEEKKDDTTKS